MIPNAGLRVSGLPLTGGSLRPTSTRGAELCLALGFGAPAQEPLGRFSHFSKHGWDPGM